MVVIISSGVTHCHFLPLCDPNILVAIRPLQCDPSILALHPSKLYINAISSKTSKKRSAQPLLLEKKHWTSFKWSIWHWKTLINSLGDYLKSRLFHISKKYSITLGFVVGILFINNNAKKNPTPNPTNRHARRFCLTTVPSSAPPIGTRLGRLGICRLALNTPSIVVVNFFKGGAPKKTVLVVENNLGNKMG